MKIMLAGAALVSSAAWAAPAPSPALVQYMAQLQCATALSFQHLDAGLPRQGAMAQAAASCTSPDSTPDTGEMAANAIPPLRAERIDALVRSVKVRMLLCDRLNLEAAACVEMFGAISLPSPAATH